MPRNTSPITVGVRVEEMPYATPEYDALWRNLIAAVLAKRTPRLTLVRLSDGCATRLQAQDIEGAGDGNN